MDIFVHMTFKGYIPKLVICCLQLDSKLQKKSPQPEIQIFKREKQGNLNKPLTDPWYIERKKLT